MFNVISIEKKPYFIFNNVSDKTLVVKDFEKLIETVAKRIRGWNTRSWAGVFKPSNDDNMLKSLNMTGNDTVFDPHLEEIGYSSWGYKVYRAGYKLRQYTITDSEGRVIDIRNYQEDITKKMEELNIYEYTYKGNKAIRFRQDPVPRTGRNWPGYVWYRQIRTTNEIRQNSDTEIKQFIRKARTMHNLPTAWDDVTRCVEKSWKHSCKVRKQYMKHFKDHGKSIRAWYKNTEYSEELEDFNELMEVA